MDPNEVDDYESSDDEDYVPPETANDDENDNIPYDDVEDDLENGESVNESETKIVNKTSAKDEKQRIDQLFADFLDDGIPTATPTCSTTQTNSDAASTSNEKHENESIKTVATKEIVTDVFDFAGETVEVKRVVDVVKTNQTANESDNKQKPTKRRGGGLANAVALISKKKKMTVLDKTGHDWKQFVEREGIEEDLKSHTRSRDSYLDKQDFLLKADYSQFEKEKALRQVERSKNK